MRVRQGDVLLTSGVGSSDASWKDRLVSSMIIEHQEQQMRGFIPTRSHAEWLMNDSGATFAARWKTCHRAEGMRDYIGGPITIGRSPYLDRAVFATAWDAAKLDLVDGATYPIHRIIAQGISTWVFPWLTSFGRGSQLICSEIVTKLLHFAHRIVGIRAFEFVAGGWSGLTPAHLEQQIIDSDDWEVLFTGTLTRQIYNELTGRK